MAIGSGAEVGVVFGSWKDMTDEDKEVWFATFRERYGDDLLKGYGTLAYPKRYHNGVRYTENESDPPKQGDGLDFTEETQSDGHH